MQGPSIQSLCQVRLLLMCCSVNAAEVSAASPIEYLTKNQASPEASIEQVRWLAGSWQGQIWGGQCEEIWSKPLAGSMMASCKFIQDQQVQFYELMTIAEHQGSLILRLKHLDKALKG